MALNIFVLVLLAILLADYLKKNRHAFRRKLFCFFVATNVFPLLISILAYYTSGRVASLICNIFILGNSLCILAAYLIFLYAEHLIPNLSVRRLIKAIATLFVCLIPLILFYPAKDSRELDFFTGLLCLCLTGAVTISLFTRTFRDKHIDWNIASACPIFFSAIAIDMLTPNTHVLPAGISVILILIHFYRTTDHLNTDALTGALNRRKLELDGNHLFPATQEVVVFMMDVDKFKRINDTYGHDIGDKVLRDVVSIVKGVIRANDFFFRIGGDEFLLLIAKSVDTDIEKTVLSRIDDALNKFNSKCEYLNFTLSLSIGHTITQGSKVTEVLHKADSLMYEKKQKKVSQ